MQLTWDQLKAVESIDKPTAIIAGAGSGKTEVLTSRLSHILKNSSATLNQILAITFTEKAAQEMKRRIAGHLSPEAKKELPWAAIGTFHSFCLNVLKEHAPLVGLSNLLSVWDEHTTKLAIHKHCLGTLLNALHAEQEEALLLVEELEFRNTLQLLEELMAFRWHWEKLETRNQRLETRNIKEKKLLGATKILYNQILENYTEEKSLRQTLDFQDLEILTLKLFKENEAILKTYQNRFQHILVDEAQDLNDLQQEFVRLLFHPKKNCLCIVGDPKQSIYRFRGANVEGFQKMVALILEAKGHQVPLNENFRSRPGVLQWINHLFSHLFDPQEHSPLIPTREQGESPPLLLLPIEAPPEATKEERRKKEAKTIANAIENEVTKNKTNFGDFTLLFQSLTDVRHYEAVFKERGIPYRLFGGHGFLSAQEVLDLLFCLRLMVNREDRLALVGLMRSPLIGTPDTRITEMSLQHPADLGRALFEKEEAQWLKALWFKRETLSGAQILEQAILQTHYDLLLSQLDPSGAKLANVEQLVQLVRELETGEDLLLEELLEYFETLKSRQVPFAQAPAVDTSEAQACQLMTVHAAKGLQFPIVILPDLIRSAPKGNHRTLFARNDGLGFHLKEGENLNIKALAEKEKYHDLKERRRLLYVAMTRAREKIILPMHTDCSSKGPWQPWIEEALAQYSQVPQWTSPPLKEMKANREEPSLRTLPSFQLPQKSKEAIGYYTVTDLEKKLMRDEGRGTGDDKNKQGLSGTNVGNLVHAVFKEIHFTAKMPLETLVKMEAMNLQLRLSQKELEEITQIIQRGLPLNAGEHELPFRLKLPNAVVTGIIDFCFETKEGWVICDFKTDSTFHKEKYQWQMDLYALALAKIRPVLETRLLFLKLGKTHREPCTPERLRRAEENLSDFLKTIR